MIAWIPGFPAKLSDDITFYINIPLFEIVEMGLNAM